MPTAYVNHYEDPHGRASHSPPHRTPEKAAWGVFRVLMGTGGSYRWVRTEAVEAPDWQII